MLDQANSDSFRKSNRFLRYMARPGTLNDEEAAGNCVNKNNRA